MAFDLDRAVTREIHYTALHEAQAHSLLFHRVAPKTYQHTVSTVIHLVQSSPAPVRSFQERVQDSICELTNCSRQLHHNPSPRSHVNCFSFYAAFSTTIVDPHDSTAIPAPVFTEATPLSRHSHSSSFQNILPVIARKACHPLTIRPESSRSTTAARQTRHP